MSVVTFGEIMARLAAPGFSRFRQCLPGKVDVTFAGAEANVAASLSLFGANARFVTALPEHAVAQACVGSLRNLGVDTDHIVCRDGRLGLYFLETGANQRPSQVFYDRDDSAFSLASPDEYDWSTALQGANWFHTTGITPAVSRVSAEATMSGLRAARELGMTVSCDLNFRKKLWRWDAQTPPRDLAEKTMRQILPLVDVLIANEEDCHDVLGIQAEGADVDAGTLNTARYPEVARRVVSQFPNVKRVAITLRESLSASHNNWGGLLYDVSDDRAYFAPLRDGQYAPYEIKSIVDRVGGGDSFAAGLIFASTTPDLSDPSQIIRYAVAASCLAHSLPGDFNFSSRSEVESLMGGSASGRVIR